MITRTDTYAAVVVAAILLIVGLTVLVTGVCTTADVGPVIIAGTTLTVIGTVATAATSYRATRHYLTTRIDRAAAALVREIVAHDARLAAIAAPPDATVVPLDGQARRLTRETTT